MARFYALLAVWVWITHLNSTIFQVELVLKQFFGVVLTFHLEELLRLWVRAVELFWCGM